MVPVLVLLWPVFMALLTVAALVALVAMVALLAHGECMARAGLTEWEYTRTWAAHLGSHQVGVARSVVVSICRAWAHGVYQVRGAVGSRWVAAFRWWGDSPL